ncbi:MAG: hypothetical protein ACD_62C00035G0009 [uncultured bacterium]|nr:MAG: hypothetical protein ACD_62C00035G0009 [uncultured bacterium]
MIGSLTPLMSPLTTAATTAATTIGLAGGDGGTRMIEETTSLMRTSPELALYAASAAALGLGLVIAPKGVLCVARAIACDCPYRNLNENSLFLVPAARAMITHAGVAKEGTAQPWYRGALHLLAKLAGARNLTNQDVPLLPENLEGVSFAGVRVDRIVAEGIVKRKGSLAGAILVGDFRSARLSGADLTGADLTGADLRKAKLTGADLSGAILIGADLSGADLTGADLRNADLRGADLYRTILEGADLTGADLTLSYR